MEIHDNYAYGIVNGFETNAVIRMLDNVSPVVLHISFYATDIQRKIIEEELKHSQIKWLNFRITPYGMVIGLNDITAGRLLTRIDSNLETIYSILKKAEVKGYDYCPLCGTEQDHFSASAHTINGFRITLDHDCVEAVSEKIQATNQDYAKQPNRYLKGFWGALLGALIGGLLAIVLCFFGYISAFATLVSMGLGTKFYLRFGGKANIWMTVIIALTTLAVMLLSIYIGFVLVTFVAAFSQGLFLNPFDAFHIVMQQEQFSRLFYGNLITTAIFTLVEVVIVIPSILRSTKRTNPIQ